MLNLQRILVPTDLSASADEALRHAAFLADWHDAELVLLNVAGRHMHRYEEMRARFPFDGAALDRILQPEGDVERHLPRHDELAIEQEQVEHASPATVIAEYADDQDVDLIVMGTRGRRGMDRLLMGSVAEEVVRTTACPVLTVRDGAAVAPGQAFRRILVPVDFSEPSHLALDHAKELAMTYGAEINLLHVVEDLMLPTAYGVEPIGFSVPDIVDNSEDALRQLAEEEIGYEHVVVESLPGYPSTTILDYIDERDVDLVVIATHGRTGIDRLLLGSVAEKVVRRAPCPVFTVKHRGRSLVAPRRTSAATKKTA